MLVGAFAMLADFGPPFTRWITWTASRSLVGGLAGVAAVALIPDGASFMRLLFGVGLVALVEATADLCLAALTAVVRNKPLPDVTQSTSRVVFGTVSLYAPIIAMLAYAYVELSPWTLLLFFVPAVAAQRLFVLYQEQRRLADDLASANDRLEGAGLSFATALVAALDAGISTRRAILHAWLFTPRTSPPDSACPRNGGTLLTSLGWYTTSAKSAYQPGCSRSRAS